MGWKNDQWTRMMSPLFSLHYYILFYFNYIREIPYVNDIIYNSNAVWYMIKKT